MRDMFLASFLGNACDCCFACTLKDWLTKKDRNRHIKIEKQKDRKICRLSRMCPPDSLFSGVLSGLTERSADPSDLVKCTCVRPHIKQQPDSLRAQIWQCTTSNIITQPVCGDRTDTICSNKTFISCVQELFWWNRPYSKQGWRYLHRFTWSISQHSFSIRGRLSVTDGPHGPGSGYAIKSLMITTKIQS